MIGSAIHNLQTKRGFLVKGVIVRPLLNYIGVKLVVEVSRVLNICFINLSHYDWPITESASIGHALSCVVCRSVRRVNNFLGIRNIENCI